MKLSRHGDLFSLEISRKGQPYEPVGAVSIRLKDPVYAGLAVSSHDEKVTETAVFSSVSRENLGVVEMKDRVVESTLEVISVKSDKRRVVYRAKEHFEAPNWLPDGKGLLFNSKGRIYTIGAAGGEPKLLDTGAAVNCNNDHGITFDGKTLIISDGHEGKGSVIYTLPLTGGEPKKITDKAPSYWHGVSPDGKTLAYCAERNGEYDVYTIGIDGGQERQLTNMPGLDDGPEYSPDGKYIYFNSVRTGLMKIWRMKADGSEQSQMTFGGDHNDWFAHPSPDNKQLVFVSYDTTVEPHTHLPNKNVELRIMSTDSGEPSTLTRLFGGQGTINVPSWSPDSNYVAFVSYRLVKP
jgi:Tol biopolymer transport system component